MAAVAQDIRKLLVTKFEVPDRAVADGVQFAEMELDSLVLVQLAMLLERRYGIPLDDADLIEAGSIERTVELLRSKGAAV